MNCPICDKDTYVIDSRKRDYGVFRRRSCKVCNYRINTLEIAFDDLGDLTQDIKHIMQEVMQQAVTETITSLDDKIKGIFTARSQPTKGAGQ